MGPHKPWSERVRWAREELNLRPLPCQQTTGNRCARRRSCRSAVTVGIEVKRSPGVQLTALFARAGYAQLEVSWRTDRVDVEDLVEQLALSPMISHRTFAPGWATDRNATVWQQRVRRLQGYRRCRLITLPMIRAPRASMRGNLGLADSSQG
jgi:hypothetical protein